MKKFIEYLVENEKTYAYRLKIAGEVSAEFLRGLKEKLAQFDPVSIGSPRVTPVQKQPEDFPGFENERVTIIDIELRYPAIHPQMTSMAQMLGVEPDRVYFKTLAFDEGMDQEFREIEKQNKDLLTDTDFPAPNAEQKALSKDYSADPYDHAVLKNSYRSRFVVAGGKTAPAETTNDLPLGKDSPIMGKNKLPRVESNAR
jgi:hypothetical protein